MTREESVAMWKRIAEGELSGGEQSAPVDPWEWIQGVAKQMLAADALPTDNARNAGIVRAAGLRGFRDRYAELRDLIERHCYFSPIDADGNEIPQTQGQVIAEIVEIARKQGLLKGVYLVDDKKAKDLIRNIKHQRI